MLQLKDVAHQAIVLVQVQAAALVGGDDAWGRKGGEKGRRCEYALCALCVVSEGVLERGMTTEAFLKF